MALGIIVRNINFDKLLSKLLGIENIPIPWLKDLSAGGFVKMKLCTLSDKNPEDKSAKNLTGC